MTRILCGTLLATAVLAQQSGDVPSELVWDSKAGVCPASLTWASLRGSVVVVGFPPEFTFPEEIVQWNKLPDKFAGEPIVFIQVATGPEFFLDQALKKAPYHGCVLFDGRNANRSNYELPTFPRAIVVDSQGWIAGYARGDIDEETLRAVLDHKEASGLRARPPQPTPYDLLKLDSAPSYEVHISPAATGELRALGVSSLDRYTARNASLKAIIMTLWNMGPPRIVFPEELDEGNYDVTAQIPEENEQLLLRLVKEGLEVRFGLDIRKESRTERVCLMTMARPSSQLGPAGVGGTEMSGSSEKAMIGAAQLTRQIADQFESALNVPVVDDAGLDGRYDFWASSEKAAPESSFDMADQLGLKLTETERPVEILVVRKIR